VSHRAKKKAPRVSRREASACWRALEDLKDAGLGGNREEMRGNSITTAEGPCRTSSESIPRGTEPGSTAGTPQATAGALQEAVAASLRALRSGRLDLAVDMLERLSRALGGEYAGKS